MFNDTREVEGAERKQAINESVWMLVLGVFVLGMSVWTGYRYMTEVTSHREAVNWPATTGKVIESRSEISTTGKTPNQLYARVRYEYSVDGSIYSNNKISFSRGDYSEEDAREALSRYPLHRNVTVYYSPRNPQNSCLELGKFNALYHLIGVLAAAWLVFGIWLVKEARQSFQQIQTGSSSDEIA